MSNEKNTRSDIDNLRKLVDDWFAGNEAAAFPIWVMRSIIAQHDLNLHARVKVIEAKHADETADVAVAIEAWIHRVEKLEERVRTLEEQAGVEVPVEVPTKDPNDPCQVLLCTKCGQMIAVGDTAQQKVGSLTTCIWACAECGTRQVAHIPGVPHSILMTDAERVAAFKARMAHFTEWAKNEEKRAPCSAPETMYWWHRGVADSLAKLRELGLVQT